MTFKNIKKCAEYGALFSEDISRGILTFLPQGLNSLYDTMLKPLPLLGKIFSHKWGEFGFKLGTGITIGLGLGTDLAHYIFRPLGYIFGFLLGGFCLGKKSCPSYSLILTKKIQDFSGWCVGSALFFVSVYWAWLSFLKERTSLEEALWILGVGSVIGLVLKVIVHHSSTFLLQINAVAIRKNVESTKQLNHSLKKNIKKRAKGKILIQAQDIIQQMNGPQAQGNLEAFFKSEYEQIATNLYHKLDRHFNYLTDRACHGDLQALKRLEYLSKDPEAWEKIIERILNPKALFKLKDEVDTAYDRWLYQSLKQTA